MSPIYVTTNYVTTTHLLEFREVCRLSLPSPNSSRLAVCKLRTMSRSVTPKPDVDIHGLSDITTKIHTFKNNTRPKPKGRSKPTRQLVNDEIKYLQSKTNIKFDTPTYTSVVAPPSLKPQKHYCDITGLPGKYKSPQNGLRFHNVEIYQEVIKNMHPGVDQEYLSLRNANVVLK